MIPTEKKINTELTQEKIDNAPVKYVTDFGESFTMLSWAVYEDAKQKGWWDNERNDGELIALIHSELSEALEALRNGNPPDDKLPAFSNLEVELADVIIRVADFAGARGLRIGDAVKAKMLYNRTRPHRHGKRF